MDKDTVGTAENMTLSAETLVARAGSVVADELHGRYPRNTAKHVARDFRVSESTAKGWLAGKLPQNRHLLDMLSRLGPRFAARLLAPCGPWAEAWRVEADLEEVKCRIAAIEADCRRWRGSGDG